MIHVNISHCLMEWQIPFISQHRMDDAIRCKLYEAILRKKSFQYKVQAEHIPRSERLTRTLYNAHKKESKGKPWKKSTQRSRSASHNCQSCNKCVSTTNEYSIGNETKRIGMLCQLDSIHPAFHTRPFTCELSHFHTTSPARALQMCEPHRG